jgi:hypothetical protein
VGGEEITQMKRKCFLGKLFDLGDEVMSITLKQE